jgi:hypothetical protein
MHIIRYVNHRLTDYGELMQQSRELKRVPIDQVMKGSEPGAPVIRTVMEKLRETVLDTFRERQTIPSHRVSDKRSSVADDFASLGTAAMMDAGRRKLDLRYRI